MKMKPTKTQLLVLTNMVAGRGSHFGCRGMARHGGLSRAFMACRDRGWLGLNDNGDWVVTDAGRAVVENATVKHG